MDVTEDYVSIWDSEVWYHVTHPPLIKTSLNSCLSSHPAFASDSLQSPSAATNITAKYQGNREGEILKKIHIQVNVMFSYQLCTGFKRKPNIKQTKKKNKENHTSQTHSAN